MDREQIGHLKCRTLNKASRCEYKCEFATPSGIYRVYRRVARGTMQMSERSSSYIHESYTNSIFSA